MRSFPEEHSEKDDGGMTGAPCDPKIGFFGLFRLHWESGTGHPKGTAPWPPADFRKAMSAARAAVDEDTVLKWRRGENLPRREKMQGIKRVFFPGYNPLSPDDREAAHRDLDEAWERETQARSKPRRSDGLSDAQENWAISTPQDVPGLLELEPQQPQAANQPGTYFVHTGLRFDTLEIEHKDRVIAIGLTKVDAGIQSSDYLVVKGSMSGERVPLPHITRRANRAVQISGPHDGNGHLTGDAFGEDHFAVIQARREDDGEFALVVLADQRSISVLATDASDPTRHLAADTAEKEAIINAVLRKGRESDDGRIVVAKARLKRTDRK